MDKAGPSSAKTFDSRNLPSSSKQILSDLATDDLTKGNRLCLEDVDYQPDSSSLHFLNAEIARVKASHEISPKTKRRMLTGLRVKVIKIRRSEEEKRKESEHARKLKCILKKTRSQKHQEKEHEKDRTRKVTSRKARSPEKIEKEHENEKSA